MLLFYVSALLILFYLFIFYPRAIYFNVRIYYQVLYSINHIIFYVIKYYIT